MKEEYTLSPVTYLDRRDITLIRPMIFEEDGERPCKALGLKQLSGCPVDGNKKTECEELFAL